MTSTQGEETWRSVLAEIRNELLTTAFLQEGEERPWEEFGGNDDEPVLRWAESFGDRLNALFIPLNRLEAEARAGRLATELLRRLAGNADAPDEDDAHEAALSFLAAIDQLNQERPA